ncbi:bifunctional solanapyrone synthase [Westerdykella ornata]|uniref:Bifunctional solanapyrone synthase n=1 Tax=Westerdykella ornata TaxID=318751 RepID=A0A6A6JI11_WESOR|nr:bifunctional solanapyrone synthase [Westerdykella ornata]KAF2275723.1 bifunctional solanapyrone synthase [Westerdykella ornata]
MADRRSSRSSLPTLFLLASLLNSVWASSASACSRLAATSSNRVVTAESSEKYQKLRMHHMSPTAYGSPLCIYSPESVLALTDAFTILRSENATFAVRGGGHSPLRGWADIDGGVTIVTSDIKEILYDERTGNIAAGMGNSWEEVYSYAETYGRLPVGARHSTVGLATVLGGGLSHMSSKYGFPADNVVSIEIITAMGTLVTASKDANPDLFWALKAGSTNYGIVTRVTLATYPVGKVWGGTLVYTNDHRDSVMGAIAKYQKSGQLDTNSAILPYLGISNNTIYVNVAYLDGVERPDALKPFLDIPTVADLTALHDNFTDLIKGGTPLGVPRWTQGVTTILFDEQTYLDVGRLCQVFSDQIAPSIQGWTMILMPQPIAKSMVTESWKRGANPMAQNLREAAQMWFSINIGWIRAEDDAKVERGLAEVLGKIDTLTKKKGLHHPFIFANDASSAQRPLQSYGREVVDKMRKVRSQVDPKGFFQKNWPGGYKLRN